jgi:hypothetical protein
MNEQKYMYWHPGLPKPEKMPELCEMVKIFGQWQMSSLHPDQWETSTRRWPVPEHVYHAHHYCLSFGITVPEGYEVIDWRIPHVDDWYMERNGQAYPWCGGDCVAHPILRRISPQKRYITPTDEDAKLRPQVEVRAVDESWVSATLLAVIKEWYITIDKGGVTWWKECRIEVKP